ATALSLGRPVALRYLRGLGGGAKFSNAPEPLALGEGESLREGKDAMILALGSRVYKAVEAAAELDKEGMDVGVVNARFVKPLTIAQIEEIAAACTGRILAEEQNRMGGLCYAVLEGMAYADAVDGRNISRVTLPDTFVEHGNQKELRASVAIDKAGIMDAGRDACGRPD
ncbi:transketolase C-terminal domain-containing protein, partial [Oceanidesulfovibrio marinus]